MSYGMTEDTEMLALSAIAHRSRLAIFRTLVAAGPGGLPAGEISAQLEIVPSSLSFHLKDMLRANLISGRREANYIYYSANLVAIQGVIDLLAGICRAGSSDTLDGQVGVLDQLRATIPFAGFSAVYDAICAAAASNGMKCNRADSVWEDHEIVQDIVALIDRSVIIVCDCSGRNSNVFYEIGIAHALGKEVILITQDGRDVPFYLAYLRHIRYLNNSEGLKQLEIELSMRIATLLSDGRG
jgi:DNA-binding transcriptional ArsR family regulator